MKLLVLGGTKFLGRAIVGTALERGHQVTLFTRGRTNPELFPDAEHLHGDREGDLSGLSGRSWDTIIDTSGQVPRVVRASAELLADSAGHYAFVSSISAYADFRVGPDEDSPTAPLGDLPADELLGDYSNYGPLKALCEEAVREVFHDHALIVRPGLIVGAHDPTGRFTYWPHRVARGGEVLLPGPPERAVQLIDVRDLGDWIVDLSERRAAGTYNATGPGLSWNRLLETCRETSGSDARPVWVDDRVPRRARRRRVDGASALDQRSRLGRHAPGGRLPGPRGRPDLSPACGDRASRPRKNGPSYRDSL